MNDLYFKIVDFVFFAKKLEVILRRKYNYEGKSIFRGKVEKVIPYKGIIEFDGIEFEYFFHGVGIEYKSNDKLLRYNHYAGENGLGVYFTLSGIMEYFGQEVTLELEVMFNELIKTNLIKQWMPEIPMSKEFYLV